VSMPLLHIMVPVNWPIDTTLQRGRDQLARATLSLPHLLAIAEDYGLEVIRNRVILNERSINAGSGNSGPADLPGCVIWKFTFTDLDRKSVES
jgi:hypothetical protein